MSRVTMRHPDLPDQPIVVNEASVPHYQASGWQLDDSPQTKTETAPTPERRRRAPEGNES